MLNSVRKERCMRKTIIIQRITIFVLCVVIIVASFVALGQMRLNRFSQNIIFSDNYFLRNYPLTYLQQLSVPLPTTYTVSEAESMVRSLVKKSGLFFPESCAALAVYRPERALDRFDILSYYYNYLIEMFDSHDALYVLFSPEINAVINPADRESDSGFPRNAVVSCITDLVERSFSWEPAGNAALRENIFYIEGLIHGEREIDYDSYEKYFAELKQKIVSTAIRLLASDLEHREEYTAEEMYLLYYDSIAENLLSPNVYLPAQSVFDLLETYENSKNRPRILDAVRISQLPEYPNGCEAVSAVMLLNYAGFPAEKDNFIEHYLEKGEMKIRFGVRFGPDPAKQYAGDPASVRGGWGCFAPVIVRALEAYLAAEGDTSYTALNVSGAGLSVLCETFIDRSIPVAIWITQDYSPVREVYQWLDHSNDQVYLYPANQHCVMLIGYDRDNYYVCDPLKEEAYTVIAREAAEISYTSMGSQAVVLLPTEP